MWRRWTDAWRGLRERRAIARRAVPDDLWQFTLAAYPFLAARTAADRQRLRELTSLFLDRKEFTGAHGFVVSDDIAVAIAAQACLPVLQLGLDCYDGFVGIIVHDDQVVAPREVTDDDGVVHRYDEVLTGEAMEGGPVMLTWADVRDAGEMTDLAYNVVIHEFAHVLDMIDGEADGVPKPLPPALLAEWLQQMPAAYEAFCNEVDAGVDTLIDPYGAEAPSEFFAVASEAFFVAPHALRDQQPGLYRLLAAYYRQDPAAG